ncbi:unnamed protein product [Danaus chrysippus]|uniref:(African queen) hypothetical protein n=1 Tax=Danaus chrysippus TaxID=151541 RepID=A0A8J2QTU6_9NEOP|nr:unnamed protein product [Danaus chrysippus]
MDEKEIPENHGENDNETGGINTTDIKEVSENNCIKSEENSECGPSEPGSIQNSLKCDVIKSDVVEKSEKCDEKDFEVSISVGDDTTDTEEIQKEELQEISELDTVSLEPEKEIQDLEKQVLDSESKPDVHQDKPSSCDNEEITKSEISEEHIVNNEAEPTVSKEILKDGEVTKLETETVSTECTEDIKSSIDNPDTENAECIENIKSNIDNPDIENKSSNTESKTKEQSQEHVNEANEEDYERREVGKPEFETAPNVSMDDHHEDHTQALDPFDALLKDRTDTAETSETAAQADLSSVDIDDDDHHNDDHQADDVHDIIPDDEDEPHPDDESGIPDITEQPGADEEVCLLPDTEREISEADKAAAEKVLAEKRKRDEEAALAELAMPKEEAEVTECNEIGAEEQVQEDVNESLEGEGEVSVGDTSQDNVGDKENDQEDAVDFEQEEPEPNSIRQISATDSLCVQCNEEKSCQYRYTDKDGAVHYICVLGCVKLFQTAHPGQYIVVNKKYMVEEIIPKVLTCSECEEKKTCYFYYNFDGEDTNYCSVECLHSMMADERDKYTFKRRRITVEEKSPKEDQCCVCENTKECIYNLTRYGQQLWICDQTCLRAINSTENGRYLLRKKRVQRVQPKKGVKTNPPLLKLKVISNATDKYLDEAYKVQGKSPAMVQAAREERERTFIRLCMNCHSVLDNEEKMLTWEAMDFCNETCLGRYQNKFGSKCTNCKALVQHTSLGKYCVRFGYNIRQFCNSACLEDFKKGLKICCYCQKDISDGSQGFLAPVGDKGQFKDFCSQLCMEKFDKMSKNPVPRPVWAKCAVCSLEKATTIEVEVAPDESQRLCSDPCFAAFKFVNNIFPDQCRWCKIYFERKISKFFTIYEGSSPQCFCSKSCMNIYISNSRHIVPCNWCKVKKYNFDMIKRVQPNGQDIMMCSVNCLNLYQVSINAVSSRRTKCDLCKNSALAQYHLTMSDATVRNFCTYQCVMTFQGQYSKQPAPVMSGESIDQQKAVPTGAPRRTYNANTHKNNRTMKGQNRTGSGMPVISNVQSLAAPPPLVPTNARSKTKRVTPEENAAEPAIPQPPRPPTPPPPPPKIYNHVIVKTLPPQEVANKATMSKPMMVSKGVSCRPHPCTKECQTDPSLERRVLIPVPVPIYVPVPCVMWSLPFPVPVPIPIPIPTPVFIPTTRNSAKGIMKEINKIHDKMPTDPFEAELLMMAEMVAGDKKKDHSDSDTEDENEEGFSPVAGMDGNNAFGEDVLQMALKMATEYEDQPVDLESAMTANTITPSSHPGMPGLEGEGMHQHHMMVLEQQRAVAALRASSVGGVGVGGVGVGVGVARKRAPTVAPRGRPSKRRREPAPAPPPDPPREPQEKPDANMCLKYTFGVNAWKQWVMTKNAEIEKSSIRRKPFKSEILQLTADELNYSLCLFVKEVRKPNGSEYAPDTIYYLVLGIQQYLFENGRIDNIFTDPYYEKFTDCLDEVARKFSVLYNDSQYIVTRVEEEHLWESKQLGAHSPHVLLSTLMFFNTKHFNLVTVEEHMQLSFSHIMKHWKRNPNQPGQAKIPGSRNVLLRFYPPQSALEANSRKKKVYEQQENEENPLRCPVKLYEFYISKCPESVRTRNDVFYLQPERSCVPDSPVWYSTQPLSRAALAKMLHRVKMVKEINIALLTS